MNPGNKYDLESSYWDTDEYADVYPSDRSDAFVYCDAADAAKYIMVLAPPVA